jgi:hypothetical protein
MAKADFLILPTLNDTFGYDSDCHRDLRIGRDLSSADAPASCSTYIEAYWSTIDSLASALTAQLRQCWETRSDYEALSAGALTRIDAKFHASGRTASWKIFMKGARRYAVTGPGEFIKASQISAPQPYSPRLLMSVGMASTSWAQWQGRGCAGVKS